MTVSTANESRPGPAEQGAFALLLLWLAGVCLRVTVLAIPPVIPLLHRDLNLSETDILGLALPSVLSAPDDVHRTSAGMFTVSYTIAMVLSVAGGWLWDFTRSPIASFVPVALCAVVVMALASTANHPDHPANASD